MSENEPLESEFMHKYSSESVSGKKNVLMLVIDALRFDALDDIANRPSVAPNLSRLAREGYVQRAIANGQSTQFALSSIFSQSYPLDYGGYNDGIRSRPKSFVEVLQENGYTTQIMAACLQVGVGDTGYERGFDLNANAFDYSVMIEQKISRMLLHELRLWQHGVSSREKMIDVLRKDWEPLLRGIEDALENAPAKHWPKKLRLINASIGERCRAERELLASDPDIVLDKLTTVAPGVYHRFLGSRNVNPIALLFFRVKASIGWRTRKWQRLTKAPKWHFRSQFQAKASEIFALVIDSIRGKHTKPWFIYAHVMDVHDCNYLSRPLQMITKLAFLPRWLCNRMNALTNRHWLYDTSLLSVDQELGRILSALESEEQLQNTIILVTGDHGLHFAESPRPLLQDIGDRFHYEDLNIPILVSGANLKPTGVGVFDNMSCSATLLHALSISPHASFKGRSIFEDGREFVISENAGRGNADLRRNDLHFAVTTRQYKMLVKMSGSKLAVRKLFDCSTDPQELLNVAEDATMGPVIDQLFDHLWEARGELLLARGARRQTTSLFSMPRH